MNGQAADWTIEVGDADFEREVLQRSEETPVVVDFWASWCAPCRVLGPVIERLAAEYQGQFILAKVNVDEAPAISTALGIQGIPAVKGFRDGALVGEFTGAQPENVVRQFLAGVLPTEADLLAREAAAAVASGDLAGGEIKYQEALARESHHPRALLGLARLLAERAETAAALELLDRVLPSAPVAGEAQRFAAELRTRADGGGDESALRQRLADDPADLHARLNLGRFLAAQGRYEAALAELLALVQRDPHFDDDAGRKAMVDIFTLLGPDDPLTDHFRSELAKALYR